MSRVFDKLASCSRNLDGCADVRWKVAYWFNSNKSSIKLTYAGLQTVGEIQPNRSSVAGVSGCYDD